MGDVITCGSALRVLLRLEDRWRLQELKTEITLLLLLLLLRQRLWQQLPLTRMLRGGLGSEPGGK